MSRLAYFIENGLGVVRYAISQHEIQFSSELIWTLLIHQIPVLQILPVLREDTRIGSNVLAPKVALSGALQRLADHFEKEPLAGVEAACLGCRHGEHGQVELGEINIVQKVPVPALDASRLTVLTVVGIDVVPALRHLHSRILLSNEELIQIRLVANASGQPHPHPANGDWHSEGILGRWASGVAVYFSHSVTHAITTKLLTRCHNYNHLVKEKTQEHWLIGGM